MKEVKGLIALKLIDTWMFVPRTGENCTGLDSNETHSVVLLLSIAEVDDDIGYLFDVLGELHFLIIQDLHELAHPFLHLMGL